jgi:hypothetical protein
MRSEAGGAGIALAEQDWTNGREGRARAFGEGASTEPRDSRGWQAHSARRESCNAYSSPEHAVGWLGEVSAEPAGSVSGCCIRPVADATCWYGCGSWRRAEDWTGVFDSLHPYFPAEVSEMPDHKSSPNARVNQPISNGLSWLMGVTGTQSSTVSGVPRTSP